MTARHVLGIDVDADVRDRWRRWLAPEVQPFFVDSEDAAKPWELTPERRDTYKAWRIDRALGVRWLDEATFLAMPRADRATLVRSQVERRRGAVPTVRRFADLVDLDAVKTQADGHRFVWWPSLLTSDNIDEVLTRHLADAGLRASRHAEVPESTWRRCADLLPDLRRLAGTFPRSSGPNCFGTVLAAAGVDGADVEWVVVEPFLAWLESSCRRGGGDDDEPGTVLVWRDRDGQPVHAAITIGDGWAFEKPSQEWSTPRTVLRTDELIRANRTPGQRLERHRLQRGG